MLLMLNDIYQPKSIPLFNNIHQLQLVYIKTDMTTAND